MTDNRATYIVAKKGSGGSSVVEHSPLLFASRLRDDARSPVVVHVVGSLQGGGAERCVRELVPRLCARGMDAEIATVYLPNLAPNELAGLGCKVHYRSKRPGFDAAHCWWLARTIARRKPAIVHTHMQAGKYVGRLAALLAGVPIIVHTEHSPNPLVGAERYYAQLFWRRTTAVIAFAEQNAEIIRQREPVRRFEIIRNGVNIAPEPTGVQRSDAREQLGADDGTVVFAMIASLQERKNHRLAFAALAQMKDEPGPRVQLSLFGHGALRDELERLADFLGIAHLVRFHGFRPDVLAMLAGVDVLLSVATLEMAPISILEAMANCIPVVATPHPGAPDMVEDGVTGAIVDWKIEALCAAMRTARDDRRWREACGKAGRRRVERNHDIEAIADQHIDLYRRLLRSA